MAKKNVLFFTNWYPSNKDNNAAVFIKRHAKCIAQKNNVIVLAVNIYYSKKSYLKSSQVFTDENGIETHQIIIESKWYKFLFVNVFWQYFIVKRYLKKNILAKTQFDIIHSNVLYPCTVVAYLLSKKFNRPLIITEHWSKIDNFFNKNIFASLANKALQHAKAITVVSPVLKETLSEYVIDKNKIYTVPNLIDNSEFYYDDTITKNTKLTFVALAKWNKPKNPHLFINALEELYKENLLPKFKLVIIGEGKQLEEIKSTKHNFEIEYKGELNSKEIMNEFNKSHVFLHGSDFETFSVVIIEALFCGLPILCSPIGIAPMVINKSNGAIADYTLESWKEKIQMVSEKNYDNKLISASLVETFGIEKISSEFNLIYSKIKS